MDTRLARMIIVVVGVALLSTGIVHTALAGPDNGYAEGRHVNEDTRGVRGTLSIDSYTIDTQSLGWEQLQAWVRILESFSSPWYSPTNAQTGLFYAVNNEDWGDTNGWESYFYVKAPGVDEAGVLGSASTSGVRYQVYYSEQYCNFSAADPPCVNINIAYQEAVGLTCSSWDDDIPENVGAGGGVTMSNRPAGLDGHADNNEWAEYDDYSGYWPDYDGDPEEETSNSWHWTSEGSNSWRFCGGQESCS